MDIYETGFCWNCGRVIKSGLFCEKRHCKAAYERKIGVARSHAEKTGKRAGYGITGSTHVFIILALGILALQGCKKNIPDGLYVGRKLIIANATVEQFLLYPQQKIMIALVRNNKCKWSR